MNAILLIGLCGAVLIGYVTGWKWLQHRLGRVVQSLELRLKLRERDLRLAEERLRRLEAERWRPSMPAPLADPADAVEVDAEGLPKRAVPAAVQAELLGLQHSCAAHEAELARLQRELAASSAEVLALRARLDGATRGAEAGSAGEAGQQGGAGH